MCRVRSARRIGCTATRSDGKRDATRRDAKSRIRFDLAGARAVRAVRWCGDAPLASLYSCMRYAGVNGGNIADYKFEVINARRY